MDLVYYIKKIYDEYLLNKLYNGSITEKIITIHDVLPSENSISYFDEKIYYQIKQEIKNVNVKSYTYSDTEIELYLCNDIIDKRWESYMFFYSNFLLYLLNRFNPQKRKLKLILINYKGEKTLPENNAHLTPYNVNSGVTSSLNGNGVVIVYRHEEMIKVLTHELVHFFEMDQKHISSKDEQFLNEYFKIECKSININESFVDSLACLINIIMYTILSNPKDIKKAFKKNLMTEVKFIVNQGAKVLKYLRFKEGAKTCEKTHVTSYYVIKSLIYMNIHKFMMYLKVYGYMLKDVHKYIELLNFEDLKIILKMKIKKGNTMKMSSLNIYELNAK